MHLSEKISSIITTINQHSHNDNVISSLIKDICDVFDLAIHEKNINDNLVITLYYFANFIGVPQYFDLFCQIKGVDYEIPIENRLILNSMISESNLHFDKEIKLHIFQKELLDYFKKNEINRYLISAATSFGKTYIIYSLIEKMNYNNVVLIFPTVSLLSENLERFLSLSNKEYFRKYKIITLSEETLSDNNILIFTPERFMTFIDKNPNSKYDFIFIDEIYKIDNDFINNDIIDDDALIKDKDRDVAFRIALELSVNRSKDLLLAGPFLNVLRSESINNFISDNNFKILNYNSFDLVNRNKIKYSDLKTGSFDGIKFDNIKMKNKKPEKLYSILSKLSNEQSIVYCQAKYLAEDYALKIADMKIYTVEPNDRYCKLINHLENQFGKNWCLVKSLKQGIGIHHGTIPKYIQREIIRLYNEKVLKCIFTTTTITEGVNTTAKNMIILSSKKGREQLKKFDILNIMGRAGRFSKHFSGRIFIIDSEIDKILETNSEILSHKNYSEESKKSEVDLEITKNKYLNNDDIEKKKNIEEQYNKNNIPETIRKSYLMIPAKEKIELYKIISKILKVDKNLIYNIIKRLNTRSISLGELDKIVRIIKICIDEDDKLNRYMEKGNNDYSVLTYKLNSYLIGGYRNMLDYLLQKGEKIDVAVRETSKMVYSVFRYELVKHISVMDLIYRTVYSNMFNVNIDDVVGLNSLLSYLEYGAYTEKGRKASDFGVPFKVLEYIENPKISLDNYEKEVYSEVKKIIEQN